MTTKRANEVGSSSWASAQSRRSSGRASFGRPPGSGPSTWIPWEARFRAQLTVMAPSTAMRSPGIFLDTCREMAAIASAAADRARATGLVCSICTRSATSFPMVPCPPPGSPSIPEISPMATWMPTPDRNPTSTVRDRKSAKNPSRASRARTRKPAAMSASMPDRASLSAERGAARVATQEARMAAVAESAPTTRCREAPKIAYRTIGSRRVYRPVMTGVPEILV